MSNKIKTWKTDAGPRQTANAEKAIKSLLRTGAGTVEIANYGTFITHTMGQDTPAEAVHRLKREAAADSIHEKYDGIITAKNYKDIIADCEAAKPALLDCQPVIDKRKTEEEEAEEKARQQEGAEKARLERAEAEERKLERNRELAAQFPHLIPATDRHGGQHVAKNIRIILKREFPCVSFSVTSDYSCVQVGWTDGPTPEAVETVTNPFRTGHFDGMTDYYECEKSDFKDCFGDVQYIFTNRELRPGLRDAVKECLKTRAGMEGRELELWLDRETHKLLRHTDLTGKGAFKGVEYVNDDYILTFEPVQTATGATVQEHYHTKKGFKFWLVVLADRVEREAFYALKSKAKASGGWYSRAWGQTPGGFAFKEKEAADAFAASIGGGGTDSPPPDGSNPSDKLRGFADGLQSKIEEKRAPLTQNPTPKRSLQYRARILEAEDLERGQQVLRALADLWDEGNIAPALRAYTTKKAILEAVETIKDHSGGYYSLTDTGRFRDTSQGAVALQSLLTAPDPERVKEQTVKDKILDLAGAGIEGFFPTPAGIVERMIKEADIQPGETVLEPSAGIGNIADAAKAAGGLVQCVELRTSLCEILELKGHEVEQGDFMDYEKEHDKVLMNPPFERGQDQKHVRHAYRLLKEGGRLIAIMSEGAFFRADSQPFRDWMDSVGGWSEKLPEGSFKGTGEISQTGISARMIVIDK